MRDDVVDARGRFGPSTRPAVPA
ncbi:MAG: hypothetical protein QOE20_2536, partial [Mycobacterium sp.]|nr:hypothetical protein [Mycobacterium sp.]